MTLRKQLQRFFRRILLGESFEEGMTKALPPRTQVLVDRTALSQRGEHIPPMRPVVEAGGNGPRKIVGFPPETLRSLARTNPWLRAAIDIRKREVANAEWDIIPSLERFEKELITLRKLVQSVRRFPDRADKLEQFKSSYIPKEMTHELIEATKSPELSSPEVRYRFSLALTDRYMEAEANAAKVRPLFENPNRNPYGWSHILQATLPDLFILDAMSIEKRRTARPYAANSVLPKFDNPIVELHWVDGATVRPVIDKHGMLAGINNPEDNDIAYEQWIDGNRVESGGWRFWDLMYLQENPQTDIEFYGYGFSRVESLIITSLLEAYGDKENLEEFKRGMYGGFLVLQKEGIDQEDIEEERMFIEEELEGTKKLPLIGLSPDGKVSWVSTTPHGVGRDKKSVEAAVRLVKRIAATFEMPLIKLAEHSGQTNFATSKTTQAQDDDGLRKLLAFLNDSITRNIVAEFGFDDIAYASDPQHMRDEKERLEQAKEKLEIGIWELNDARMEWGEDPKEDGDVSWWYWSEKEKARGQAEGMSEGSPEAPNDSNEEGEDAPNTPGDSTQSNDSPADGDIVSDSDSPEQENKT